MPLLSGTVNTDPCVRWTTPNTNKVKSDPFTIRNVKCYFDYYKTRNAASDYCLYLNSDSVPAEPFDLSVVVIVGTDTVSSTRATYSSEDEIIWRGHISEVSKLVPDFDQRELTFQITVHDNATTWQKQGMRGEKSIQADLILLKPNLEHLASDLGSLLDSEVDPDVRLNCKDGIIQAHRLILSARSKVFATMFRTDMAEKKTGEVNLQHLDRETTGLFLKFIYSGDIPEFPGEMAPALYLLADEYEVPSLKRMCSDFMTKNVSEENYTEYLVLADKLSDENFKRSIVHFIIGNPELMRNEKWGTFSDEHMKLALEVLQTHMNKLAV